MCDPVHNVETILTVNSIWKSSLNPGKLCFEISWASLICQKIIPVAVSKDLIKTPYYALGQNNKTKINLKNENI